MSSRLSGASRRVLKMAREGRWSGDPVRFAPPSMLWQLADGDSDLYRHAMQEAGHLVSAETGEPFNPCRVCGWDIDDRSVLAEPPCDTCDRTTCWCAKAGLLDG